MKRILEWLEARLSLRDSIGPMLMHPIPRSVAGPMGWWYVFGSASLTLLMIQVLSGIGSHWCMCRPRTRPMRAWST